MSNIINAICNLVENPRTELMHKGGSHNRANSMGEALEEYIKDLFAGVTENTTDEMRDELIQGAFSYTGNQSNPPDAMLWGGNNGDAIEIKKIESPTSALALNSSYPKHKLYASSSMISTACRKCEDWTERDIIYAVGVVGKATEKLESLAFVYGEDYCASKECYERIKSTIKNGVETISNVEFSPSKELGHVNRVDPLGITYLRIRGMWGIENPFKAFERYYQRDKNHKFDFMAIINEDKYNSFENTVVLEKFAEQNSNLNIKNIKIKNPDNPSRLVEAKLITFFIGEKE